MILQIITSVALGFLIGMEREQHEKSIGIRTVSLITLGATLFCLMSPITGDDTSRVVAQVVSGIGFLGAGVIFKDGCNIRGLTTAATIWASAAIGCLVGMGLLEEAILGAITIVSINMIFKYFKNDR